MKEKIHPKYFEATVTCGCGNTFKTGSTKKIRALENSELAKIPIIAMTANAFSEDVENAKAAGMNAHIAKPLDVPKMIETLTKILTEKK